MRWISPFDNIWDFLFSDMTKQEIHVYIKTYKNEMFSEYKDYHDEINNVFARLEELERNRRINIDGIRFNTQRNDSQLNDLSNQIDSLNKKINELQKQIEKNGAPVYIKQSVRDDKIVSQLLSKIERLESKIAKLEKLSYRDSDFSINNQFDVYKRKIEKLEQTVNEQNKLINAQETTITKLEEKIEKDFGRLSIIVEQLMQKNETVIEQQAIEEEKPKEEQSKEAFDIDALPVFNHFEQPKQPLSVDDWFMPNQEKQYDIKKFDIAKTDKLFLSGDTSKIKIELQKALNTDNIIQFLQQSSLENKQTYLNIFERYKKHIQKFIDNADIDEDDEDIWENITEDFFKIVQNDILSNFMIGIYRGIKNEKAVYEQFLNEVNKYLTSCCIYTRYIHPDVKYTKDDLNDMVPLKKETNDLEKDDYIDEVERLPYYIDYLNEDGEKEYFCYDGKFVILKYEEKK